MSDPFFAALDIGLVFALALGLAVWQLVALKRGMRRDREAARAEPPPGPERERR